MAHVISFSRSRCTTVEELADGIMTCTCRVTDNLMDARVQIQATLPELEIRAVNSRIDRWETAGTKAAEDRLQNLLGMRIGPGMLKIIRGLMGDDPACIELAYMFEECCQGAILRLTKDELNGAPVDPDNSRDHYAKMVKKNTRLYNRCAAFADGSSILEGIEIPEQGK